MNRKLDAIQRLSEKESSWGGGNLLSNQVWEMTEGSESGHIIQRWLCKKNYRKLQ